METRFLLIPVFIGLLQIQTVHGVLRCIECDHIAWNQTFDFNGAQNVYQILQSKYNPACAQYNPYDRTLYQQNQQQTGGQFPSNYEVGETICQQQDDRNRCNYVFGNVLVYLPNYDARMRLNIHYRNCETVTVEVENRCYERDTSLGYYDLRNFIETKLSFVGDVTVENFRGHQCYCSYNLCYPYIASGRNIVASALSIVLAAVGAFLLR